ncbi:MAG: hypothetical protein ACOCVY_00315 [Patescibacteria group bacterium]
MDIVIDLTPLVELFNLSFPELLWVMFVNVGWIPIAFVLLWGFKEVWMNYINDKWVSKNAQFTILALDVPRGNEQSPKAVENIFHYLAGAHGSVNLVEKYWEGKIQLGFSFEIVSLEGYTQFLIRTPVEFRNLVESAVYSQYPDAEITEVEDYTRGFPTSFPNDEYDAWGSEFVQVKNKMFPIKTYRDFYDPEAGPKEAKFKDPLGPLMDLNSSLGKGEYLWHQIILTPIGFDWMDEADKETKKILGEQVAPDKNLADKIGDKILGWIDSFGELIFKLWGDMSSEEKKEDEPLKMMNLKPKDKKKIEALQQKASKTAFKTKVRMVYMAKKDVINKAKVVNGFVGYMKQYADLDLNNLKPDIGGTATTTAYFYKDLRANTKKNRIVNNYIKRSNDGRSPGLMNTEELATLWHFPVEISVKAPKIQKVPATKAQPPMGLPGTEEEEEFAGEEASEIMFPEEEAEKELAEATEEPEERKKEIEEESSPQKKGAPPNNLPVE